MPIHPPLVFPEGNLGKKLSRLRRFDPLIQPMNRFPTMMNVGHRDCLRDSGQRGLRDPSGAQPVGDLRDPELIEPATHVERIEGGTIGQGAFLLTGSLLNDRLEQQGSPGIHGLHPILPLPLHDAFRPEDHSLLKVEGGEGNLALAGAGRLIDPKDKRGTDPFPFFGKVLRSLQGCLDLGIRPGSELPTLVRLKTSLTTLNPKP